MTCGLAFGVCPRGSQYFSLGFSTSDDDVEEAVSLFEETLTRLLKAELVRSA